MDRYNVIYKCVTFVIRTVNRNRKKTSSMYTSKEIADWILSKIDREAGDTISPLKLQKILYYCQAWYYTLTNRKLFDEDIQAWAHGPVVPSQYKRFSYIQIYDNIKVDRVNIDTPKLTPEDKEILDEVYSIYGEKSASYLERLTHAERPWKETRGDIEPFMASTKVIPLDLMKEYYSSVNH